MTHQKNRSVAVRRELISDHRVKVSDHGFKHSDDLSSPTTPLASATVGSYDLSPESSITISDEHKEAIHTKKLSAFDSIDLSSPTTSLVSAIVALDDNSPMSSMTISDEFKESIDTTDQSKTMNSATGKLSTVEAKLVVKYLRRAIKSKCMDLQSKKILDALVNLIVEEFIQLPEEKECFDELPARKAKFWVLCFLLLILVGSAALCFFNGSQRSFTGVLPPT